MKLEHIFLENSFNDLKDKSGYRDTFIPINILWLDGVLHFLRNEKPFRDSQNAETFANKIEEYFNRKYGNMVYHKSDDKSVSKAINYNWTELKLNPTIDQIKKQIKFTDSAIKHFIKVGIVAPEGQHDMETDFWLDQNQKDLYMTGKLGG